MSDDGCSIEIDEDVACAGVPRVAKLSMAEDERFIRAELLDEEDFGPKDSPMCCALAIKA